MSSLRWFNPAALRGYFFAVGIAAVAVAQGVAPVAGTMPEDLLPELKPILLGALDRSPDTIRRGIEFEQAEAHTYLSRGAMLPNVAGYMRYALNSASTASGNSNATSTSSGVFYALDVNQPVYHWGALKAQAEIDQLAVKIAARQFAEMYRVLATMVRARFLELVAKKAALRTASLQLKQAEMLLARDDQKLKDRALTPGDLVGPRLGIQEAQLGYDRAVAEFSYLKRVFTRLVGLAELADDAIPADIPRPAPAADRGEGLFRNFLRDGAANTYVGQIFSFNIQQSDLNYRIAKTWLYPKFSAYAGYSVSNSTQADFNQVRQEAIAQRYVGVLANWPIFDGRATTGRKLEALGRKRANERQLQTYVESTTDAAQNLQQQVGFAARALELAETRFSLAQKGLEVTKENLAQGLASKDDVTNATLDVQSRFANPSGNDTINARVNFLNRWVEFVSLVGADPAMNNLPPRYVR